jgi:SMC interacting uncharacterized protein involved in chromosome segregation
MAVRRQTLAPITNRPATATGTTVGKRMSMAPSSQSTKKVSSNKGSGSGSGSNVSTTGRASLAASSTKSRQSLAPRQSLGVGVSRQSSVGGSRAASSAFDINEVKKGIIVFLTENKYPHPLSPQKLQSPAAKEVAQMYDFVIRKVSTHPYHSYLSVYITHEYPSYTYACLLTCQLMMVNSLITHLTRAI